MHHRTVSLVLALAGGLAAVLAVLLVLAGPAAPVWADPGELYVAPGGDCGGASPCYDSVQAAVDAAAEGDVIKVATGVYTGVQARPATAGYVGSAVVTQVVYISKTVTVRGGYTTTNWAVSHPLTQPTTLDAQEEGRVLFIAGTVSPTVVGLRITGGDAVGLGGHTTDGWTQNVGGGIYVATATVTISNSHVLSNATSGSQYASGGGLYVHRGVATVVSSTIQSNRADAQLGAGGGVYLECGDATFIGSIISGNTARRQGGGLFGFAVYVVFEENVIAGNVAIDDSGGGVCLEDSVAVLHKNTFVSNTSGYGGGGLSLRGIGELAENVSIANDAGIGGGISAWGDVRLEENIVVSNSAEWTGGGVFVGGNATLVGNTISANVSGRDGGGVGGGFESQAITLIGNTITGNSAARDGGGVYLEPTSDSLLAGNAIISNTAGQRGGGLFSSYGDPLVVNSIVAENVAGSQGSGLYVGDVSSVSLLHTTIARNSGGDGSGVYAGKGSVVMTNTILVSHTVGIYVASGRSASLEATLWGAGAWANGTDWAGPGTIGTGTVNVWGDPVFVDPDTGDYHIGAASSARNTGVDVNASDDIDGQARPMDWDYDIGADEYPGAGLEVRKSPVAFAVNPGQTLTYTIVVTGAGMDDVTGVILTDTLDGWQQAVDVESPLGECTIVDTTWGGRVACSPGTVVSGARVAITLTAQVSTTIAPGQAMTNTVVVTSNETVGGTQVTVYGQDCHVRIDGTLAEYTVVQDAVDAAAPGGLVKVAGVCVGVNGRRNSRQQVYVDKGLTIRGGYTITDWLIPDPEANPTTLDALGQGRVIYVGASASPIIEGLHITGGDAMGLGGDQDGRDAGGGIYVLSAAPVIHNNQVFSCAARYGGGAYLFNSAAVLSGNVVHHNGISGTWGEGGGLYLYRSDAVLSGNAIVSNTAPDEGGGMSVWYSAAILRGNTIQSNTTSIEWGRGGGLYLHDSPAILEENAIVANTAGQEGGGLYLVDSAATLGKNTFVGNIAGSGGGGLYLSDDRSDPILISGNSFISNTADIGGGLFLRYSKSVLVNNVIAGNQATGHGSGLCAQSSSPKLIHTTIAANRGLSGVLITHSYGDYSALAMTNTIIVSHTVGVRVASNDTARLESTLWNGNDTDWDGAGAVIHNNDYSGNPVFVNPGAGDYHIGPGSAAVDAGVDAGVREDMDGEPRPMRGGYDIGADELGWASLAVTKHASPEPVPAGGQLTYTIRVTNLSSVTLAATITDVLPTQVTPNDVLTWTTSITAPCGVWMEQFTVTVDAGYTGVLTNVVRVTTEEGMVGTYTHTVASLPTVDFSSDAYRASEGIGSAVVTATLNVTSMQTVTAHYTASNGTATAGSDYTSASGTLTFSPGVAVQTFTVAITQDETDEYDETVILTLSDASNAIIGGNNPGTLTIEDDDGPPNLSIGDVTVTEGDGGDVSAVFTVTLSTASGKTVTVEYVTADGDATAPDDYIAISTTTLPFDPGITTQPVTVTVKGDTLDEADETFWVNLANETNASIADDQGQGTIEDDDAPPTVDFDSAAYTVGEGAGMATVTVTLNAASGKTVTVQYATSDGTATAGSDYTSASSTLTLTPGVTSQAFTVTIIGDGMYENDETIMLTLSNADNATIGGNSPAVLTITEESKVYYLPLALRNYP